MSSTALKFVFTFFRFVGDATTRSTEIVRDYNHADGMRGLIDRNPESINLANERVNQWAEKKGLNLTAQEPFPSDKYPGKVWLEYRFGGLAL